MATDLERLVAASGKASEFIGEMSKSSKVEKTIWCSPAGKKRLADRLAGLLPAHKTYVEPFAGSAAVLFAKEPAEVEVINDADPEIVEAYRIIKQLSPEQMGRLRRFKWIGDVGTFKRLFGESPKDDVEKLHRFLYISHFSYGNLRSRSFSPSDEGIEAATVDRIERFGPRLKNVRIHCGDYERVVRKYDGKDAAFYLDPPYPGYNVDVGESDFDEARFLALLKSLKGKFLLTYGTRGELPARFEKEGFQVKRIRPSRTIGSMRGVGGPNVLTTLFVSNYDLVEKSLGEALGDDWEQDDVEHARSQEPTKNADMFVKSIPLIKGLDPADERYVLGVVLEPEVVDAQGDIYSAEEVRHAAHLFMEEFGGLGLMHRMRVNGMVKVLESFLAPVDFVVGEDVGVRRGAWLLAVRILDDTMWNKVKTGELTGFSIGGSGCRDPIAATPNKR